MSNDYDGYFDLTVHKTYLQEQISKIATEGYSAGIHDELSSSYPDMLNGVNSKRNTILPSSNNADVAIEAMESMIGLLPMIRVTEANGVVTVSGIPTNLLVGYILKHWNTNRITNNMLLKRGMRWFSFYSFYAIEIIYMLQTLAVKDKVRGRLVLDIVREIRTNTWIADTERKPIGRFDYSRLSELNVSLLPNQMDYLKVYEEKTELYGLDGYVLAAPPGTGKALLNGTPVLSKNGWVAIDKLKIGDQVYGYDGLLTSVTGVHRHKKVKLYNLKFEDGRTIVACKDHQWSIFSDPDDCTKLITVDTVEMLQRAHEMDCIIPLCVPFEGEYTDLSVSLDDFIDNVDDFTSMPDDYLMASSEQRLEILNSFIDEDDNIIVANEYLAKDFVSLARSLGYQSNVTYVGDDYVVYVKRECLGLKLIDFWDHSSADATCISVDNQDKLYIAKDYIVTHNTINGFAMGLVSGADTTIFVVPNNSVDDVWVETVETRFKRPQKYWSSHGNTPIHGDESWVICHYEALGKLLADLRKFGRRKIYVWLDESHNFNELSAARTNTLVNICKSVNMIGCTWASGTPFKAIGKEAVPMMRCICKQFTPDVELSFIKIFGATKGQALDILAHRMGIVMFKVPKLDVVNNGRVEYVQPVTFKGMEDFTLAKIGNDLKTFIMEREAYYRKNMPMYEYTFLEIIEKVSSRIKDPMERNRLSSYIADVKKMHGSFQLLADRERVVECNKFEREVLINYLTPEEKKDFKRVSSVYKYVILTIRGEALGRILTRARVDCFKNMVPNSDLKGIINSARKKTLIFTTYVDVADQIRDQCIADGFKPLVVYGDTNKNLPSIMSEFKNKPEANPLIATYDSLSTAVPVIEASTVVLFNAPFRDYIRDQAVSRADRLGQDGEVTVVNVLLDTGDVENISTRSKDIMQWSKEQVDIIMGMDKAEVKAINDKKSPLSSILNNALSKLF